VESDRAPVSTPAFWNGLYAAGQAGWDLGEPSPPLAAWLDSGGQFEAVHLRGPGNGPRTPPVGGQPSTTRPAAGRPPAAQAAHVAIPGAGRGHDARLLARHGYRVTAFDFAEPAVAEARRLAAAEDVAVQIEARDVFTLSRDHAGVFDAVWEYTCFCAIDPARREEYVRVLHAILKAGGILLACFYPLREGTDGPPFPVTREAIDRVLAGRFTVLEAGPPARSVERRRGLEWLVRARREPDGPAARPDR
jgi:SAM-dependent methyltransferase